MGPIMNAPPQPPDIRKQMKGLPAWMMMAANRAAGQPVVAPQAGAPQQAASGTEVAVDRLRAIADLLAEVVQVIAVSQPSLLPLAKVMAEAGSELMNGLQSKQTAPVGGGQPESPAGDLTAG